MNSSPQAQRATGTLARIALINERRALSEVQRMQRVLDEQSALRDELKEAQRRDEEDMLQKGEAISAGLLQMLGSSRRAHTMKLQALDNAMGETAIALGHRRNAHDIARMRQRSASKVAERVQKGRLQDLQHAQQKAEDDLTTTRYGHRSSQLATH